MGFDGVSPYRGSLDHFVYLRLGAGVARKGWLTKADVVNTLSLAELRKALKGKKK
jgi:DNA polymerase (family 10)